MSTFQRLKTILLQLQRNLSFSQVEAILDQIPHAVLLLDVRQNKFYVANAKATELTAYTRAELRTKKLEDLFPNPEGFPTLFDLHASHGTWQGALLQRNGAKTQVDITATSLNDDGDWFLLNINVFETPRQGRSQKGLTNEQEEALHELTTSSLKPDLQSALISALNAGARYTGSDLIAVYQIKSDKPALTRLAMIGNEDIIPNSLPGFDINHLQGENLWTPSKHAGSSLQKAARTKKLSYLLTMPLGESKALLGMLAFGSENKNPDKYLVPRAQIVADIVTICLQTHILTTNLNKKIHNQISELNLGQAVKDSVEDGLITLNPDLKILELNTAAELILGYATQEVHGQGVQTILIGTNTLIPALRAAQEGIATPNLGTIKLHRRDGQAFQAHVRTKPVKGENGIDRIIIIFQDLSEHEQFRVRTQQLEQRALLGEVTAIFAHEVGNPINNISTGLQLLAIKLPDDDPNQAEIVRLQEDCARLDHLMKSVLDFSRTAEYKLEAVDLEHLIKRLLNRWRPHLARAEVKSHLQFQTGTPAVNGDQRALEQVFTNLISNAVQAMSEDGGTLAIKAYLSKSSRERPRVHITISDSGPGIPEEIKERIFEPFFTTNPEGTGLGLAITQRIIVAHKGSIHLTSFPGGTIFQIQLPVAD